MRIKYFLTTIKTRGFCHTIKIIISGYFKVNKFLVFYKNLEKPFDYPLQDPTIEFAKISLEELHSLRNKEKKLPVQFYCDLSHNFSTPFIALVKGKVAAIHWVVLHDENSRFLEMKKGDVELNYNTVLPEFEGKGLSKLLQAYIIKNCIKKKHKRMFGVVNVDNIPQYKLMLRLGFEPVEVLTHFGFSHPKATLKYVK
ncbi:MAG: GNAT family N-acetyltransferase [Deltaproteobacteria bacterium]|nr:GNAT family N-acetyltransferase [Deltaproteobacteria bacterium]